MIVFKKKKTKIEQKSLFFRRKESKKSNKKQKNQEKRFFIPVCIFYSLFKKMSIICPQSQYYHQQITKNKS